MSDFYRLIWSALVGLFRSQSSLEAEILVLRHQLNILRRKSPKRPAFQSIDWLVMAGLYGLAPTVLSALAIVRRETVIRWLCVPKTSSALIRGWNRLTLADHDRADLSHLVGLDRLVQAEEPA